MKQNVIKVQFFKPVDGQTEYYFGSIAALYERFSPSQIGCKIQSLWVHKLSPDHPKATDKCVISKHIILRKSQKSGT